MTSAGIAKVYSSINYGGASAFAANFSNQQAHVLASQDMRYLSQDVICVVVKRIGVDRSRELIDLMWKRREHYLYESDFSVLDSLMRGFMKAGLVRNALVVLDKIREEGLVPSLSATGILFRMLIAVGDFSTVWSLFRDMVVKGPRISTNEFNVMLDGFCGEGCFQVVVSLFYLMGKFGCEPDAFSYNILIKTYCTDGRSSEALAWVREMIENGCGPNVVTFNTIIDSFCKQGNMVEARRLFDQIQERDINPTTVTYNTLINGYVKAREIRLEGLFPLTDISVAGLCWAGQLDDAMGLLQDMLQKGMPPSVVAFNSIIAGYSKAGREDKAFEVYRSMAEFGLTPSSCTCSSLLLGLSNRGMLQEAGELLDKMVNKGFPINRVASTVLLDGYFNSGDLIRAHKLWGEMKSRRICPDVVAFSAFIDGLSNAGRMEEAYEAFEDMLRRGITPNNFTYNSLIGGFCNCGKVDYALKLEKEMRQNGLIPDIFNTNMIINGFCKQGSMKAANNTFMHRFGQNPDIVTYNTLISGYIKAFDLVNAEDFLAKMWDSGWQPDIISYNTWIHVFCSSRKIVQAVRMLDELIASGFIPNTVTCNTMVNGVCCDILERAMILTAKLLKMAFVPNVVTSTKWDSLQDAEIVKESPGEAIVVDFLMHITFDYIAKDMSYRDKNQLSYPRVKGLQFGHDTQLLEKIEYSFGQEVEAEIFDPELHYYCSTGNALICSWKYVAEVYEQVLQNSDRDLWIDLAAEYCPALKVLPSGKACSTTITYSVCFFHLGSSSNQQNQVPDIQRFCSRRE
ncbi:hypothetical protein C5167_029964 [Papaver somniferum]|nr:hypothetical protein C5167_029964 [Papaver somniferum]